MFLQYYGLREQPFGVTPNPRYLYHSPAHREALASLIYGIEADLGFAALIAEPGMGKTTLLFYLLEKFRSTARTALVFQTQCSPVELFRYVANELEVGSDESDPVVLFERIRDVLVRDARARRRVILIIDEAQNLSEESLEAIRLLSDFETPEFKLLHIILAGQPPLAEKLARPALAQLLQRIAMLNRLVPFTDIEDVSKYIAYRLKVAGYSGPPLFDPQALELITKNSRGIPRQINRLCFNALSIGCATKKRLIDGGILREVLTDLDVSSLLHSSGRQRQSNSEDSGDGDDPETAHATGTPNFAGTVLHLRPGAMAVAQSVADNPACQAGPVADVGGANTVVSEPAPHVAGNLALSPVRVPPPVQTGRPTVAPQQRFSQSQSAQQPSRNVADPLPGARRPSVAPSSTDTRAALTPAPKVAKVKNPPALAAEERRSLAFIVVCVVAVPLLVLAAFFYLEKQHSLPGAQPSVPGVEQPAPNTSNRGNTINVPQTPVPGDPQEPKKPALGKRSQIFTGPLGSGGHIPLLMPAVSPWPTFMLH